VIRGYKRYTWFVSVCYSMWPSKHARLACVRKSLLDRRILLFDIERTNWLKEISHSFSVRSNIKWRELDDKDFLVTSDQLGTANCGDKKSPVSFSENISPIVLQDHGQAIYERIFSWSTSLVLLYQKNEYHTRSTQDKKYNVAKTLLLMSAQDGSNHFDYYLWRRLN